LSGILDFHPPVHVITNVNGVEKTRDHKDAREREFDRRSASRVAIEQA
jgi:hypothetical protein